jgi:hypothetical protein
MDLWVDKYTPMLHKQHGKEKVMVLRYTQYHSESIIFWVSPLLDSKDGIDFAMLFTLWASLSASDFAFRATTGQDDPTRWASLSATTQQVGNAGGLQIMCCQGFAVAEYSLTSAELSRIPPLTP